MKGTPKKPKMEEDDMSHARIRLRGALNDSIQLEEDYDAELPQRGRPSKNLLLAQQQTQRLLASLPPVGQNPTSTETLRPKKYNTAKKKAALAQQKQPSESFVMKLFDRSLDLSKYTEKTPLYPICRAWMANQPRNPNISNYAKGFTQPVKREDNGEEILEKLKRGEIHGVSELPLARTTDIKPVPTVLVQKEEDIAASRQLEGGSREELLADHKKRWRKVKAHWHEHTKNYEKERYAITYQIMDHLYKGNARR